MQRLQKFGIKPDGIINFLSNEPPFRHNSTLKIPRSSAPWRLIKDTTAWMPAHYLLEKFEHPFGSGVKVFEAEDEARRYTVRRKNARACNQWFRVLIPSPDHFLDLNAPISEQPLQLQESLLSEEAIGALFFSAENHNAVYDEEQLLLKRKILSAFPSAEEYLVYLTNNISGGQSSRTVSYLSFFGVAGITCPGSGNVFLVFDARRNIILKEIKRETIPHTALVS
jgi:hypothetical protein